MNTPRVFENEGVVRPEWIDYNGHMNMGYYLVAFDQLATDPYFDFLGTGVDHMQAEQRSLFTIGTRVDYKRELLEGDRLRFTSQLVDFDHKRLHYFHSLYHVEAGFLAATNECLAIYVDLDTRRSTPFSDEQMKLFAEQVELSGAIGLPESIGSGLGIRRA